MRMIRCHVKRKRLYMNRLSKSVKILLTGLPGCGKTTAIMKIIASLECEKVAGFYTQEIRENNNRKGFRFKRLDGTTGILAHVDIKGRFKVGKYGVDVTDFEKSVVPVLDIERTDAELFVIDEIGKMECFSGKFVAVMRRLLPPTSPYWPRCREKVPALSPK